MSTEEKSYGCHGCVHFEGTRWVGQAMYVVCPKLPGGESREVLTWRGCPDRREVGADTVQGTLF